MKSILAMFNIFIDPKEAVKDIDRKWAWVPPLLVASIVTGILGWLLMPVAIQAMQYDPPGKMTSEQLQAALPRILLVQKVTVFTSPIGTGIKIAILAGLLAGACAVLDIKTKFGSLFNLVALCGMISTLEAIAGFAVVYMKREEIQSLKQLMPHFGIDMLLGEGVNKQLAAFLGYFSIFQIWFLVILALGLAFMAGVPKSKAFMALTPIVLVGLVMRIGASFFN